MSPVIAFSLATLNMPAMYVAITGTIFIYCISSEIVFQPPHPDTSAPWYESVSLQLGRNRVCIGFSCVLSQINVGHPGGDSCRRGLKEASGSDQSFSSLENSEQPVITHLNLKTPTTMRCNWALVQESRSLLQLFSDRLS